VIIKKIPRVVFVSGESLSSRIATPLRSRLVPGGLDITIDAAATIMTAYCVIKGVPTMSPAADRNPDLDIWIDEDLSILTAVCTISGSIPFVDFNTTMIAVGTIDMGLGGAIVLGNVYSATMTAVCTISGSMLILTPRKNWVQWAKFGTVDFTKDKQNKSGDIPLDWYGYVWAIKVLNNTPMAYGENGVSILSKLTTKLGFTYGYKTIYTVGLKGKGAVCGDVSAHYFIDNLGQMWRLSDKLELLDYSEFLSVMIGSKLVMSLDHNTGFIYICDGTYGYVYSTKTGSFASGPVNVSGIDSRDGTILVVAPTTITIPGFEKWTDIQDMKTRRSKTIHFVEVGVDLSIAMQTSVEWRSDKVASFTRLPWQYLSPKGIAHPMCTGVEFRFGLKTATYASFEIDYINIRGTINDN